MNDFNNTINIKSLVVIIDKHLFIVIYSIVKMCNKATKLPILLGHLICWVNKITIALHCKHSWQ